jgi:hypothetical protein
MLSCSTGVAAAAAAGTKQTRKGRKALRTKQGRKESKSAWEQNTTCWAPRHALSSKGRMNQGRSGVGSVLSHFKLLKIIGIKFIF